MRNSERTNMKGLRRPHLEVHRSDQCPNVGTVNNAISGAEMIRREIEKNTYFAASWKISFKKNTFEAENLKKSRPKNQGKKLIK